MKRIGTISAAAGLIYLGTWMIINKINPDLGVEVFKWWPIVIVILGVEVLVMFSRRDGERIGFNFLIVPVLILMLIANLFNGVRTGFGGWFNNWNISGVPRININGIGFNDTKEINTSKILPAHGDTLYIHTNNASIDVIMSNSQDIRVEGKVYVDEDSFVNKYNIEEKQDANGYTLEIMDNYIKGIKFDVYVPNGYNVKFDVDNLDLNSNEELDKSNFKIQADNINIKLSGAQSAAINYGNGNINLEDVKTVNLVGDNGNVNVRGESEEINVKADNGKIDINNQICKNVNIEMDHGIASVRTEDKNVDVRIQLDQGISGINNEKGVNSGISRTLGQGTGKVLIKLDQGTANFRN